MSVMGYSTVNERLVSSKTESAQLVYRIHLILKKLNVALGYYNFEKLFMNSTLNTHFININDLFIELDVKNILTYKSVAEKKFSEIEILTNIDVYTNLLHEAGYPYKSTSDVKNLYTMFTKIIKNACHNLGHEIFENDAKQLVIVKNNVLDNTSEEQIDVVLDYFNYQNEDNLDMKRQILMALATEIEPIKDFDNHIKPLSNYIFKIFNNYHIRHNNIEKGKYFNLDLTDFSDVDYHKIYDVCFKSAIAYIAYCKDLK